MSKSYDDLKCGNCGFDGGVEHLKSEQKLHERISGLEKELAQDSDTRQTKLIITGIVTVLLGFMFSIASCNIMSPADQVTKVEKHIHKPADQVTKVEKHVHESGIGTAYSRVHASYKLCLSHTRNSSSLVKDCTAQFATMERELLSRLDNEKENENMVHE